MTEEELTAYIEATAKSRPLLRGEVERDLQNYGTAWVRQLPDGTQERIAPEDIHLKPEESNIDRSQSISAKNRK